MVTKIVTEMLSNLTFSTYIILIFNVSITCIKDDLHFNDAYSNWEVN